MNPSVFSPSIVLAFLLVVTRVSGMLITAPFFSQTGVPQQIRVALAVVISFIMFPMYGAKAHISVVNLWEMGWLVGQELAIGLLIGFAANLFFAAIDMAGNIIAGQMGLNSAQMLDPVTHENSPIIGQFYLMMAMTLFLSLNLHHGLIIAVAKSFEAIPLASGAPNLMALAGRFTEMTGHLFVYSIMLVLPVFGLMLVQEVALGFMAKIMPQMNVFQVAMPLKMMIGMILISATLPYTAETLTKGFDTLIRELSVLYQV